MCEFDAKYMKPILQVSTPEIVISYVKFNAHSTHHIYNGHIEKMSIIKVEMMDKLRLPTQL